MIWESYQVYLYEHSKFFISVTQSCCSLWISTFSSCKSSDEDIQKRMIKQPWTIFAN